MIKWLTCLIAVLTVICLLPLHASATMENHNYSDIVISQSVDDNNYYFPDAVKLNDGTILVAYYKSLSHRDDVGAIWAVKSIDNGQTWGTPYIVVDRTAQNIQSRDPNLAILPNGTIILTYFTNGTANSSSGTYMLMSTDGGTTWGSGSLCWRSVQPMFCSPRSAHIKSCKFRIMRSKYGIGSAESETTVLAYPCMMNPPPRPAGSM